MVSKCGFEASYVELLPPLERQLFLIYHAEDNKRDQPQNTNVNKTIGRPIEVPNG